MHTVSEVAELTGVTVRTLHHYDQIGLVSPTTRSDAGYRLYGTAELERLQLVLFYRELDLPLAAIRRLLDEPDHDRGRVLRHQRELLTARADRLRHIITAIEAAIAAHEEGTIMADEAMFEVFGDTQREIQDEAEQRWGDTDAYRESRRRTSSYTRADWEELKAESEAIMAAIVEVYRSGAPADAAAAMDAVEAHRRQISDRFYDCSPAMQVQLGEMYVADPRFRATYEDLAPGLADWVRDAINANAQRLQA